MNEDQIEAWLTTCEAMLVIVGAVIVGCIALAVIAEVVDYVRGRNG